MISAHDLVREARLLVGTPWLHQGRTRLGVDCIGLVILAAKNAGLDVFAAAGVAPVRRYGRRADPRLYGLMSTHCAAADAPRPGCVALFRFPGESWPRHFGILTFDDTMIHAEAKTRLRVVEHGYRMRWLSYTDSVWMLPGVRYE